MRGDVNIFRPTELEQFLLWEISMSSYLSSTTAFIVLHKAWKPHLRVHLDLIDYRMYRGNIQDALGLQDGKVG